MSLLNLKWNWYEINGHKLDLRKDRSHWKNFDIYIHVNKYLHCVILSFTIIGQVLLFIALNYKMKRRLYYFYIQTRKTLILLMIFTLMFYVTSLIFIIAIFRFFDDMLLAPIYLSDKEFSKKAIYTVGIIVNCAWFDLFWYYAANNINFKLYVEAMMYGYRVHNQFSKMSFLI